MVTAAVLMIAFVVAMAAIGLLLIFADQDEAQEQWQRTHRREALTGSARGRVCDRRARVNCPLGEAGEEKV